MILVTRSRDSMFGLQLKDPTKTETSEVGFSR